MAAYLESNCMPDQTLMVNLSGVWRIGHARPPRREIPALFSGADIERVRFDTRGLDGWDSSLVVFLAGLIDHCAVAGIDVDSDGLPTGARRLIDLSRAVPPKADADVAQSRSSLLERVGELGLETAQSVKNTLDFTGELALSVMRLIRGKARFRMTDVLEAIQQCGWQALPIVSLISLLVGLILAFMGAVQ